MRRTTRVRVPPGPCASDDGLDCVLDGSDVGGERLVHYHIVLRKSDQTYSQVPARCGLGSGDDPRQFSLHVIDGGAHASRVVNHKCHVHTSTSARGPDRWHGKNCQCKERYNHNFCANKHACIKQFPHSSQILSLHQNVAIYSFDQHYRSYRVLLAAVGVREPRHGHVLSCAFGRGAAHSHLNADHGGITRDRARRQVRGSV